MSAAAEPPRLPAPLHQLAGALSWPARVALAGLVTAISIGWLNVACHRWAPRSPAARLAAAAPAVAVNAALPLLFAPGSEPLSRAIAAFLLSWMSSFKALALAVGRGPLAMQRWTLPQLWALYALPLVPAGGSARLVKRPSSLQGSPPQLVLRWAAKVGTTAAVVFGLLSDLPPLARSLLYAIGIYSMLGVLMDGPAALLLRPLGLQLAPHFLPPWESASVAEFWGSRWNQAAGSSLRTTIYEPLAEGRLVRHEQLAALASSSGGRGSGSGPGRRRSVRLAAAAAAAGAARGGEGSPQWARLAGMTAAFFASGALHEVIMWYLVGTPTRGLTWLFYFTGQAALIAAEQWVLAQAKQAGVALPALARRALTLGLLLASGHLFFFQPAEAAGMPILFASSMRRSFAALAAPLRRLLP